MSDEVPHEEEKFIDNPVVKTSWNILYALFYPVIMLFTLVFFCLSFILSLISRSIHWIFNNISSKE